MTIEIPIDSENREPSSKREQSSVDSGQRSPVSQFTNGQQVSEHLTRAYDTWNRASRNPPGTIDEGALKEIGSLRGGQLLQKILTIYLEKTPYLLADLHEAIDQAESEQLFQAAHSLKSTSATVGANSLSDMAQALEILGKHGFVSEAKKLFPQLQSEHQAVEAVLRDRLNRVLAEAEASRSNS